MLASLVLLEDLRAPARQLAWLTTFGSPLTVRLGAVGFREELWKRGVTRSMEGLSSSPRFASVLAAVATAAKSEIQGLLGRLQDTGAFGVLFRGNRPTSVVAEAIGMALAMEPAAVLVLAEAAAAMQLETLAQASRLAGWIQALCVAGAPDQSPPDGTAARVILAAPILRGLRRHGARALGRRLGRRAAERSRLRETYEAPMLPRCLMPSSPIRDLMAPLVIDCVTAAIAELAPGRSTREGAHVFAERCPAWVDQVAAIFDCKTGPDYESRAGWLVGILGLAPQSDPVPAQCRLRHFNEPGIDETE
jgi:hypothetical protein